MRHRRVKGLLFAVFLITCAISSAYYWLPLRYTVGAENFVWSRSLIAANALEWWRGMSGRLLTHYRPGFQIAYLDPARGELLGAKDALIDSQAVAAAVDRLPMGQWLILTINAPGLPDGIGPIERLATQAGWEGSMAPANTGAGIIVLARTADGAVRVVDAAASERVDLRLTLSAGQQDPTGTRLRRALEIYVRDY